MIGGGGADIPSWISYHNYSPLSILETDVEWNCKLYREYFMRHFYETASRRNHFERKTLTVSLTAHRKNQVFIIYSCGSDSSSFLAICGLVNKLNMENLTDSFATSQCKYSLEVPSLLFLWLWLLPFFIIFIQKL